MAINDEQTPIRATSLGPAALQSLHQQFYGPVARYIRFRVDDHYTVEDLSGEVFVRILEGLRRGRAWQGSAQGWIMGITRHVVADHYRRKERLPEVELGEWITATEQTDPAYQALLGERKQRLVQAIQQLTDDQRDVILLRFMEGFDINNGGEGHWKDSRGR